MPYTPAMRPIFRGCSGASCGFAGRDTGSGGGLGRRTLARFAHQIGDSRRNLSTQFAPVLDARGIDAQPLFTTGGYGIEKPHALDETAIARRSVVSDNQMIEGTLFRPTTSQSNLYHDMSRCVFQPVSAPAQCGEGARFYAKGRRMETS